MSEQLFPQTTAPLPKIPVFLIHAHTQTQGLDEAASPVLGADGAQLVVLSTEVRGALQVHQLVFPHRPDVNVFGHQLLARPRGPVNHFSGRKVLDLQIHGDLPQVLQASPAGSYGAGAGHAMTFTLHHQRLFQCLNMTTESTCRVFPA